MIYVLIFRRKQQHPLLHMTSRQLLFDIISSPPHEHLLKTISFIGDPGIVHSVHAYVPAIQHAPGAPCYSCSSSSCSSSSSSSSSSSLRLRLRLRLQDLLVELVPGEIATSISTIFIQALCRIAYFAQVLSLYCVLTWSHPFLNRPVLASIQRSSNRQ